MHQGARMAARAPRNTRFEMTRHGLACIRYEGAGLRPRRMFAPGRCEEGERGGSLHENAACRPHRPQQHPVHRDLTTSSSRIVARPGKPLPPSPSAYIIDRAASGPWARIPVPWRCAGRSGRGWSLPKPADPLDPPARMHGSSIEYSRCISQSSLIAFGVSTGDRSRRPVCH
jgi:hypothetical protein